MDFQNGEELLALCSKEQCSISEIIIRREVSQGEESRDSILQKMQKAYRIMETSAHEPLKSEISTMGGIIGGEAAKLQKHRQAGESLCGDVTARAVMYAMAVLEVNASMGLIVAAPTAGASGVVPGVLLSVAEIYEFGEEQVIEGLFTAGAVGYLFMRNASVSGAEAGCQAEVGVSACFSDGNCQSIGTCMRSDSRTCRKPVSGQKCHRSKQCSHMCISCTQRSFTEDSV